MTVGRKNTYKFAPWWLKTREYVGSAAAAELASATTTDAPAATMLNMMDKTQRTDVT